MFELRGWKSIIPHTFIEASRSAIPPDFEGSIDLPIINFRLRRSEPFPLLEGMIPAQIGMKDQRVELVYRSGDGVAESTFWLNFAAERLEFDIDSSFILHDDGSAAAVRNGKQRCRFIWDYFGNGEIQIWDADTGRLLSRVGAFIPINMMDNHDGHVAELAKWDEIIKSREQSEGIA